MSRTDPIPETDAPTDRPVERLDARDLPPPEPLRQSLERLAELDDDVVLLQTNDRVPQHLFPKLEERGYRHDTVETDDGVVTAIWRD
nr:DUF2249 domain-containing protein [Halorarius litoreus]